MCKFHPGAIFCDSGVHFGCLLGVTAGRDFKWAAELANESAARVVGQFGPRLDAIEFDSIKAKFEI